MTSAWRSFWYGTITAIGIAAVAGVVLSDANPSAERAFSTENARP